MPLHPLPLLPVAPRRAHFCCVSRRDPVAAPDCFAYDRFVSRPLRSYSDVVKTCSEPTSPVTLPSGKGKGRVPPSPVAVPSPEGKGPAPDPVGAASAEAAAAPPGNAVGDREIRNDLTTQVQLVLEGLAFEDKCKLINVARKDSSGCMDTASAVLSCRSGYPSARGSHPRTKELSGGSRVEVLAGCPPPRLSLPMQIFARALQAEEQAAADKAAAILAED